MGTGPPDAPRPILISLRNSKKDQIFLQWHLNCKHCIAAPTRKLRSKQTICCKDDTKIQTSDDLSNKWATYYRSFAVVCLSPHSQPQLLFSRVSGASKPRNWRVRASPFAVLALGRARQTLETNKGSLASTSLCEVLFCLSLDLRRSPRDMEGEVDGGG